MPIVIKSAHDIDMIRRAGAVARTILQKMEAASAVGVTTGELDEIVRVEMERTGARSLSKNFPDYKPGKGFPGWSCISINEQVVHGVPGPRQLRSGDIVTLDVALALDGYCVDAATTVGVGRLNPKFQKLLDITRAALDVALANIKPGKRWSEVARLVQYHVERHGFSVVREFVGHGIGLSMHEDPKLPNFVTPEQLRGDFRLKPGMTLAVEPMVVAGHRDVEMLSDQWTVCTKDRSPAAHFEHTIAVTETGTDILTDGRVPGARVSPPAVLGQIGSG